MLILLVTVSSSQVSYQRSGGVGGGWCWSYEQTRLQQLRLRSLILTPVITSDAGSTRPRWLLVLLVVVGIDVGLLRLLL